MSAAVELIEQGLLRGTLVVAEREYPALLRSWQTGWILLTVALCFAVTVILKWPASAVADLSGSQPREAFATLAYCMLISVVLVIPGFPATGIVREVKQRTMELLLNSPLQRHEIYFGKALALVAFVFTLLAVTFPALACCYAMGGISLPGDIGRLYLLILILCLEMVAVGLLVGTYAGSPESALRWAYGAVFGMVFATMIPWQFLQGNDSIPAQMADLIRNLSPIPALRQLLGEASLNADGLADTGSMMTRYLIVTLIAIVAAAMQTIRRLNHALLDRSRSQGIITDDLASGERWFRRAMFLIDPQRRKSGIPFYMNPVLVKEFRSRQFGRLHWLLRLIAGCAALSLLLMVLTTLGTVDWGVERIAGIIIVAQVALIIVLTPGIAGGLIAGEREGGGWNLLRVTPLSAGRIVRGKLASVLITLGLVLCATLPSYAVMMKIKPILEEQVFQVVISLVLAAVFSLMISAVISTFFRSTAVCTSVSYGVLLLLFVGTMAVWANMGSPFSHSFVETVLSANPMAGALNAMDVQGFEDFRLVPRTWYVSGISSVILFLILQFRTWQLCQPD